MSTSRRQIRDLAPWFHNLHLPDGTQTCPDHFLGDFPSFKWAQLSNRLPATLDGWSALDVGCNAGFYCFELARRGAKVTGIDADPHYLRQARWAAHQFQLSDRIDFRQMQVYELARTTEQWDLVLFMGLFYHLRYPLLGLDTARRVTRRMLVFQSFTMPGPAGKLPPEDLTIDKRGCLTESRWPKMAFIERRLQADPTNWWAPNAACIEALLRSTGLQVESRPEQEMYVCRPAESDSGFWAESGGEFLAATGQRQPDIDGEQ